MFTDYVKDVENELIQLKAKYNALEMARQNDLDANVGGGHDGVAKDNTKVVNDNPMVLRHIEELNATVPCSRNVFVVFNIINQTNKYC